jgi:hypothetical protein
LSTCSMILSRSRSLALIQSSMSPSTHQLGELWRHFYFA